MMLRARGMEISGEVDIKVKEGDMVAMVRTCALPEPLGEASVLEHRDGAGKLGPSAQRCVIGKSRMYR